MEYSLANVLEGKLHLTVGVRSNDIGLGNPFNVFQYYVLTTYDYTGNWLRIRNINV
jgi:thymidylate synthase